MKYFQVNVNTPNGLPKIKIVAANDLESAIKLVKNYDVRIIFELRENTYQEEGFLAID